MKSLGERLRYARKRKGWSQNELANESGVKQGTISKIEREGQYKSVYAFKLAQALEIDNAWLIVGTDVEKSDKTAQQAVFSKEETEVILMYRELDNINKTSIKNILLGLLR